MLVRPYVFFSLGVHSYRFNFIVGQFRPNDSTRSRRTTRPYYEYVLVLHPGFFFFRQYIGPAHGTGGLEKFLCAWAGLHTRVLVGLFAVAPILSIFHKIFFLIFQYLRFVQKITPVDPPQT